MEAPVSLLYLIQLDPIVVAKGLDPAQQQYLDILEKTNQQLSLWWNPYGLMIAALGVLFAVLGILAAMVIFFQGREFRSLLSKTVAEYRQVLDAFIADKNAQVELMRQQLSDQLHEAKEAFNTAKGEDQTRIAALIEKLEKLKEVLTPQPPPAHDIAFANFLRSQSTMPCTNCGKPVVLSSRAFGASSQFGICLHCGFPAVRYDSDNTAVK